MNIPRCEYPRPQMQREEWMNLNGLWNFEIDYGDCGRERGLPASNGLQGSILVPFCPESTLSGVECTGFMPAVWYQRTIIIPPSWAGRRVLLHFGAVDYETEVWVNGQSLGTHRGGYSSFHFDITSCLKENENLLTVCARDNVRSRKQPSGKQSYKLHSFECSYTRTTGIWQTVWMEPVEETHIESFHLYPDPENSCLYIRAQLHGGDRNLRLRACSQLAGKPTGGVEVKVTGQQVMLRLPLDHVRLWEPGQPALYDLDLMLYSEDKLLDEISSYFGMRTINIKDGVVCLNDKPFFQRLVLDQGYYPDGIYTAPSDEALRKDIELAMALGFNGARLHQKVFEPRFFYWADLLGYVVWGEYADTGLDLSEDSVLHWMLPEWMEVIKRDFNSPSIIAWCPLNEVRDGTSGARLRPDLIEHIWKTTKALDATRPVIDASGFVHVRTDIFDVHEYEQNPERFQNLFSSMKQGGPAYNTHPGRQHHEGQPYVVSEYGGTWWSPHHDPENQMSYGSKPKSEAEFLERFEKLTGTLLDNPAICGFCYTQLYDVEQEVNGLYTYTREAKFDPQFIRSILSRRAIIEID